MYASLPLSGENIFFVAKKAPFSFCKGTIDIVPLGPFHIFSINCPFAVNNRHASSFSAAIAMYDVLFFRICESA